MVKLEWGSKRACQNCQSRFYDMQKSPIICPKCGTVYEMVTTTRKGRKAAIIEDENLKLHGIEGEEDLLDDNDIDVGLDDPDDLIHDEEDLDDELEDVTDVIIDDNDDRDH